MAHARNRNSYATGGLDAGLDAAAARSVATVLQGLATPSRVLILDRLRSGPQTVGALTEAVGMEQSAVSHQLRHLRDLGFVVAERDGRHITYHLFDDHISDLIEQALSHAEHLQLAERDQHPGQASTPAG